MLLRDWLEGWRHITHCGTGIARRVVHRRKRLSSQPEPLEIRTLPSAYSFTELTGASNPLNSRDAGINSNPTLRDLDADGDLDLMSGELTGVGVYYRNNGNATTPTFPSSPITGGPNPLNGKDVGDNSYLAWGDLDADGDLDVLIGNQQGQFKYYVRGATNPPFTEMAGGSNPMNGTDVGFWAAPTFGDLDNDGDLDLVIGTVQVDGGANQTGAFFYYENTGTNNSPVFTQRTGVNNPFDAITAYNAPTPTLIDLDGDADLDMVMGESLGTLQYFKNTGTASSPVFTQQTGSANPWNGVDLGSTTAPTFGDLDNDGDPDLVVGLSTGRFAYFQAELAPSGADLSLTQTVSGTSASAPGSTITFMVTLTNNGLLDATGIEVTNAIPAGLNGVTVTPSSGSFTAGVWTVPSLSATTGSNTATLTISGTVAAVGTDITNTAEVTASAVADPDSTPNNHVPSEDDQTTLLLHINAAPILDNAGTPALMEINQGDVTNAGTTIADLISRLGPSGGIADPDNFVATGIAIIAAEGTNGSWEYSTNSGTNWTALGAVSSSTARLLASSSVNRIRFLPNSSFHGTIDSAITFLAWDQSWGTSGGTGDASTTGGATPFSTAGETASLKVNGTPTDISLTANSVAENSPNISIGVLSTSDPDAGGAFTYSIVPGGDGAQFAVVGNELKVGAAGLDFEAGSTRSVTVRTTDQGGAFFDEVFTIFVTNVNEAPVDITLSNASIAENNAVGGAIGNFSTTDPDAANTFTYTLVTGAGSTDNASFTISGNQLQAAVGFNFEAKSSYSIRVRSTDQGSLSAEKVFTISVTNANEAPTDIALTNASVAENSAVGTIVGNFSTTDPDAANIFSYTLVSGTGSTDNATFTIVGNQLQTAVGFNFEVKSSYSIRIRSTDQGGLSTEKVFTISVVNANETPSDITLSNASIAENNAVGAAIGNFSTTDPDAANTFTYTFVTGAGSTDNASFTIVGNQLQAAVGFNFEAKSSYSIRVRSTDQGGLATEKIFTISVTNLNETPADITLSNASIAENNAIGTAVGNFSTTDPDAANTFTYTLVTGTGSTDNAFFTITGNQLQAAASFNFETKSSYSIRIRSTDQSGLSTEKVFTISVTNTNETPTDIALSNAAIAENNAVGAAVGNFSTTDPDTANTFTYTLVTGVGSTDNASFTISGNQLQAAASFNFETKSAYSIRVRSTDQSGLSTEKIFSVSVTNANETPTDIALSNTTLSENLVSGSSVGLLTTTDPDAANTFTYTLVSGIGSTDNAAFALNGNQVLTATALDFETKSSYSIRVRSTDQGGLATEKAFTITITNVNEAPINLTLSNNSVQEQQPVGTAVGNFSTIDLDAANTFTYTLIAGIGSTDNASFTISGNQLQTAAIFDMDLKSSYSIRVRTADQGGLSGEQSFIITILPTNSAPTGITLSNSSVAENSPSGTAVGNLSTTDSDAGNTFTYALVTGTGSTDNAAFTIVGNQLQAAVAFNFEAKSSYSIRVRSTDQGGLSTEKIFTISVTNANEISTDIALSNTSITENNVVGAPVGNFSTTDPDAANTFTYALVTGIGSTDNAAFTIAGNQLQAAVSFNFETKSSYSIRVRSTDQGGLSTEKIFLIAVADLNEAPILNDAGNPTLDSITLNVASANNPGTLISDLIASMLPGGGISDQDAGTQVGIAINGLSGTSTGTWEFSTDGGTVWTSMGTVGNAGARLLAADADTRLRYSPSTGFLGEVKISFVAWDRTVGTNGGIANVNSRGGSTPYSLHFEYASLFVINTAPVLNNSGNPLLASIAEETPEVSNLGTLVSDLIAAMAPSGSISDPDNEPGQGIAVIGANQVSGTWQFSVNSGTNWTNFGATSSENALLLASNPNTRVRFLPRANYAGTTGFTFVAWDQTQGANGGSANAPLPIRGGSSAFSTEKENAYLTVTPVNDAPILSSAGNPTINPIPEDLPASSNTGTLISDLIASMSPAGGLYDADPGSQRGIAIVGANQVSGTWQFSTNDGTTWTNFGTPSTANALLLASDTATRLRFLPRANYNGTVGFTWYAWDRTAGTNGLTTPINEIGGSSPFSKAKENAYITVTPVNDAPVLNPNGAPTFNPIPVNVVDAANTGTLVSDLLSGMSPTGGMMDIDGGALRGIAVIGANQLSGTWQFTINGGTTWTDFGSTGPASALTLAANSLTRIRFVPKSNYSGTVGISFVAWDQTQGTNGTLSDASLRGGTTSFSKSKDEAFITIA